MNTTRRRFLGGAGATLTLPFFPSLLSRAARATTSTPPLRLFVFYAPNGVNLDTFVPTTTGAGYAMPEALAALEPLRDDVLVLSGLVNHPAQPDGAGDHATGTSGSLTARSVAKTEGAGLSNGVSLDQLLVKRLQPTTTMPSLQLGAETGGAVGNCDNGYSCAYNRNISWAEETTPLPKLTNPRVVFDRLFAGTDPHASMSERTQRRLYGKSVLDYVRTDAERLRTKLGRTDQRKLDEYMEGVRELEKRIDSPALAGNVQLERPLDELPLPEHVKVMTDLMVTAAQTDLTRFMTFMLGNGSSNRTYEFLGIPDGHHQTSHHQKNPAKLAKLTTIDAWVVAQYAALVQRLKTTIVDDRPLLDSCAVLFVSEIGDGDTHSHDRLPVLLAGRAGGAFLPGRHLAFENAGKLADLHISLLHAFGVNDPTFGDDGTGPLPGLGAA
jgi:hypothetical protein